MAHLPSQTSSIVGRQRKCQEEAQKLHRIVESALSARRAVSVPRTRASVTSISRTPSLTNIESLDKSKAEIHDSGAGTGNSKLWSSYPSHFPESDERKIDDEHKDGSTQREKEPVIESSHIQSTTQSVIPKPQEELVISRQQLEEERRISNDEIEELASEAQAKDTPLEQAQPIECASSHPTKTVVSDILPGSPNSDSEIKSLPTITDAQMQSSNVPGMAGVSMFRRAMQGRPDRPLQKMDRTGVVIAKALKKSQLPNIGQIPISRGPKGLARALARTQKADNEENKD